MLLLAREFGHALLHNKTQRAHNHMTPDLLSSKKVHTSEFQKCSWAFNACLATESASLEPRFIQIRIGSATEKQTIILWKATERRSSTRFCIHIRHCREYSRAMKDSRATEVWETLIAHRNSWPAVLFETSEWKQTPTNTIYRLCGIKLCKLVGLELWSKTTMCHVTKVNGLIA